MAKPLSLLIAFTALAVICGCGDDKPNNQIRGDDELIIGSWQAVYFVVDGEIEYLPNDELFCYFEADGSFRLLEDNHDGTYDVDCQGGTYSITADTLSTSCSIIDAQTDTLEVYKVGYSFSANGDTLEVHYFDDGAAMTRADDAPDWRDWNR